MTSRMAKNMPFNELSLRLRELPLIRCAKLIFHRVCVLTFEGEEKCTEPGKYSLHNVRIFLASYMIAWYPEKAFEDQGQGVLEKKLIQAAVEMLEIFQTLCDEIITSDNWMDTKAAVERGIMFRYALQNYESAYQEWKVPDEKKLIGRITHALNALQDADDQLIEHEAHFFYYRSKFRSEKKRLIGHILKMRSADEMKTIQDERACKGQSVYTTAVEVSGEITARCIQMG